MIYFNRMFHYKPSSYWGTASEVPTEGWKSHGAGGIRLGHVEKWPRIPWFKMVFHNKSEVQTGQICLVINQQPSEDTTNLSFGTGSCETAEAWRSKIIDTMIIVSQAGKQLKHPIIGYNWWDKSNQSSEEGLRILIYLRNLIATGMAEIFYGLVCPILSNEFLWVPMISGSFLGAVAKTRCCRCIEGLSKNLGNHRDDSGIFSRFQQPEETRFGISDCDCKHIYFMGQKIDGLSWLKW